MNLWHASIELHLTHGLIAVAVKSLREVGTSLDALYTHEAVDTSG